MDVLYHNDLTTEKERTKNNKAIVQWSCSLLIVLHRFPLENNLEFIVPFYSFYGLFLILFFPFKLSKYENFVTKNRQR